MKKRLLASLLSATILLSMTPMAFADEEPVGEDITEPAQVETVDETVPQAEPQEEDNAPVVQEDPQAEETPADIVIDSDTTWSEARTLTGDLTVNSGATLTIGAQVTVSGDVTISGATITNNTAEQNGAGVMVGHNDKADHCTVNITGDTEIKSNHGGIGGGVYVANDAECSISGNTKIENNTTGTTVWSTAPSGGGIAVIAKGVLNISENVSIQNNQAVKYGGGIYFGGNSLTLKDITIRGGLTDGSYNAERGGAIATSGSTVEMTGVTIDGNRALRQGGGIYLNNKSTTITDSTISNNFVDIITTDTETDGIYGSGGGIFTVSSATDCTIQNTKITNNTANALASWLGGGGIYTDGNTAMTLIGCTISGNQAANASGGGIQNRGTLTLQDTTVSNNTAKLSGGGIDHREKTVSVLGSVVISGNTVNGKANNFYPEYRTPPKDTRRHLRNSILILL